jgi:hypothetical protein
MLSEPTGRKREVKPKKVKYSQTGEKKGTISEERENGRHGRRHIAA